MAKQIVRRKSWTDAERQELIIAVQQRPQGVTLADVAHERGVNPNWLRKMRERYLHQHPNFLELASKRVPVTKLETPVDFRTADSETKKTLIKEYDKLSTTPERAAWREAHNVTGGLLSYHRRRLRPKRPGKARFQLEEMPAILAEYEAITEPGGKGRWLKEHGLHHQSIHDFRKRIAKAQGNSGPAKARKPVNLASLVPPVTHPSHLTLEDGLMALKVQRDGLNAVIETFERMLRGNR